MAGSASVTTTGLRRVTTTDPRPVTGTIRGLSGTVNPVNADQIIEQLKLRAQDLVDPSAAPLLTSEERRVENGGRPYRQQEWTQQGRLVLRKILVEGLGHAWSGGDTRYDFNDANGPDASRFILDFVMQYQRQADATAALPRIAQGGG